METALTSSSVTSREVEIAIAAVERGQAKYMEGRSASQECIIESILRCRLTHAIMARFAVDIASLPSVLNSSHTVARHVCIAGDLDSHKVENPVWAEGWQHLQTCYGPLVNIPVKDQHNPSRADLYMAAKDGILSIEFKYVNRGHSISTKAIIAQMKRYAEHAKSFLVLYVAGSIAKRLEVTINNVERGLRAQDTRILVVTGPTIERTKAASPMSV